MLSRYCVLVSWLACTCACGPRPGSAGVGTADAIVYITSNVSDAQLYLDGRFVGPLDALGRGIAVEPGAHRLELRRDSYFARYLELQLSRAEHRRLAVDLAPILP